MSFCRRQKGGTLEVGTRDFLSCKWNASSELEHLVARRMWTCGPVMCAGSHRSTQTHKHRRHVEETVCTFAIKKTNYLLPNFRRIKQSLRDETLHLARYKSRTKQIKTYWATGGNN